MNKNKISPINVVKHDQGPNFHLSHQFGDLTHSKIKNGGSIKSISDLEKPIKKVKEVVKLNHFV